MKKGGYILIALTLLAGGGAYIWFFMYKKAHADVEESDARYSYWYVDFMIEALENREASHKKFIGTGDDVITEISGIVKTVEKGDSVSTVVFGSETEETSFHLAIEVLAKFNRAAIELLPGDSVRSKAVYVGIDDPIDEMGISEPGRVKFKRGTLVKIKK